MKHIQNQQKGFSLVESAIVLVVIALIGGTALTATSITKSAESKRIVAEIKDYQRNVVNYEAKYLELPGDSTDAVARWGRSLAGDGNGDGKIEWKNTNDSSLGEALIAWEHLHYAGFSPDKSISCYGMKAIIGGNTPASAIGDGGYYLNHETGFGNYLGYGQEDGNKQNDAPVFTAEEARSLDAKIDDGNAATGLVRAETDGDCAHATSGEYILSDSGELKCSMKFKF